MPTSAGVPGPTTAERRRRWASLLPARAAAPLLWLFRWARPDRHLTTGVLVVATNDRRADALVRQILTDLSERRVFSVLGWCDDGDEDGRVARMLEVSVRRGFESAMQQEIRLLLAGRLEVEGGYCGVPAPISLRLAAGAMSIHRVRKALATHGSSECEGPIEIVPDVHAHYCRQLGLTPVVDTVTESESSRPVDVAVLDHALDPGMLAPLARAASAGGPRVTRRLVRKDEADTSESSSHAAMVASIITACTPHARITCYLALRSGGDELSLLHAIQCAVTDGAEVVVLALRLDLTKKWVHPLAEDAVARALRNATAHTVLVSSGNTENGNAAYPATLEWVVMVGATDGDGNPAPYSGFRYAAPGPALHVAAPGGGLDAPAPVTAGGVPQQGTSVAVAYAAGAVAHHLATTTTRSLPPWTERHRAVRELVGGTPAADLAGGPAVASEDTEAHARLGLGLLRLPPAGTADREQVTRRREDDLHRALQALEPAVFVYRAPARWRTNWDGYLRLAAWWASDPPRAWTVRLPLGVDLIVLNTCSLATAVEVLDGGVVLRDTDRAARVRWQADVRHRWSDEQPGHAGRALVSAGVP